MQLPQLYCFQGFEMVTFIRKMDLTHLILTQIGRLRHNLVKPFRLQNNIGKIVIFSVFKGIRQ